MVFTRQLYDTQTQSKVELERLPGLLSSLVVIVAGYSKWCNGGCPARKRQRHKLLKVVELPGSMSENEVIFVQI